MLRHETVHEVTVGVLRHTTRVGGHETVLRQRMRVPIHDRAMRPLRDTCTCKKTLLWFS